MIKLNDLAIGYNGEAILEHIDQEFDDGLIYGILAKSGAGKTTLLKTISGLLHPVPASWTWQRLGSLTCPMQLKTAMRTSCSLPQPLRA